MTTFQSYYPSSIELTSSSSQSTARWIKPFRHAKSSWSMMDQPTVRGTPRRLLAPRWCGCSERRPTRGWRPPEMMAPASRQGGLIAFLDSDDRWLPRKLELQVSARRAMSRPCLLMSGFRTFRGGRRSRTLVPACLSAEDQYEALISLEGGPVTASLFMLDTDLALANVFDHAITPLEDLELAIRLAGDGIPIIGPHASLVEKSSGTSPSHLFTPRNSIGGQRQPPRQVFGSTSVASERACAPACCPGESAAQVGRTGGCCQSGDRSLD